MTHDDADEALPIGVAVIASYPTARAGLRAVVSEDTAFVLRSGDSGDDAVLLVDLDGAAGLEALGIPDGHPAVLLWPAPPGRLPLEPARAHLLRDAGAEEIRAAIRAVASGLTAFDPVILAASAVRSAHEPEFAMPGQGLTAREHEVLRLLAEGFTNKAIARRLGISDHTAKFHVGAILSKLDAESRTEAVTIAARSGLLPL